MTSWSGPGDDQHPDVAGRVLLAEAAALGLTIEDLLAASDHPRPGPTLGEIVGTFESTFSPATAATYRPYWRLAVGLLGDRTVDGLSALDLQAVVDAAAAAATKRRSSSSGRASRETTVAALRAVLGRARDAGMVSSNPAAALAKPRRARSRRRALTDTEALELIDAVRSTSPDSELDLLLLRFHLETGARRGGALGLRALDLDPLRCIVWLREKYGEEREQPVSPTLVGQLQALVDQRPALHGDAGVLRRRDGNPITGRHYDSLFARARTRLIWATRTPVSAHVLRHTAITAIGRIAGYPVAQAFAGHTPPTVTGRYLHATLPEIAAAVAVMTGEAHPLAEREGHCRRRA